MLLLLSCFVGRSWCGSPKTTW